MDNQENITTEINRERGPGYMTVVIPVNKETAILMFENKHGCKPDEVKEYKGKSGKVHGWMLGPVLEGMSLTPVHGRTDRGNVEGGE